MATTSNSVFEQGAEGVGLGLMLSIKFRVSANRLQFIQNGDFGDGIWRVYLVLVIRVDDFLQF